MTFSRKARLVATPRMRNSRKRAVHAGDGLLRRRRPGGDLLEQRIVEAGDHRAGIGGAAVEADAEADRAAIGGDAAVVRDEVVLRVLGGDAALQGVAVEPDRRPARHAGAGGSPIAAPSSDADLRLDDVDAGHLLGDGVLDLDARIDLDEVELAGVGIHQEFDGAGADDSWSRWAIATRVAAQLAALRPRRDRAPARARRPSGGAAGPSSRARTGGRRCRGGRRGSAPRRGGRARPASRDRPRPCRRRPWPRAWRRRRRASSCSSSRITRMPRPPPPHDAFSISG